MISEEEKELNYLRDRLDLRHKTFMEWLFVDRTIIQDYPSFHIQTKKIEEEVKRLTQNSGSTSR